MVRTYDQFDRAAMKMKRAAHGPPDNLSCKFGYSAGTAAAIGRRRKCYPFRRKTSAIIMNCAISGSARSAQ